MARQYTITTGRYSNFRIVARVEGADRPALSTLVKQFNKAFGFPSAGNKPLTTGDAISDYIGTTIDAEKRAKHSGLQGDDKGELFTDWLVKQHGFKVLKNDEFYV